MDGYTSRIRRTLLPAVLIVALGVRFWGLGFGLPFANARPDETSFAGPAVHFLSGDLRPPYFMYPTFLMYVVALLYLVYWALSRPFTGFATLAAFAESRNQSLVPFFYLSRGFSAVMGTLTVWWIYDVTRRVFDDTVAIVTALFLALSFLHVRDSHFGVTDVTMTALIVVTVREIVRWQQTGDPWRAAAAGLTGGLATSTKYNGLGVLVPFAVATLQCAVETRSTLRTAWPRLALGAAIFGATFVVAFLAASPYIVIDWRRFLADVAEQRAIFVQGQGMAGTRGWWHHAQVTLPAALGWPIYLGGAIGAAWLLATRLRQAAVVLAFPLAYYIVAGTGYTVFARYMIPIVPFFCLAAAWLVVTVVRATVPASAPAVRRVAIAGVALLAVAPPALKVVQVDRLLARTDNRVIVSEALASMIPPGSSVYHSGEPYGHVYWPPGLGLHEWFYDASSGTFGDGARVPQWIVLQRSPLIHYSRVPATVELLVRDRYELMRVFPVTADRSDRLYDQQDAFFLPLGSLAGIERPGPSFEVYRLADRGESSGEHR
jgi:hypothetical protein